MWWATIKYMINSELWGAGALPQHPRVQNDSCTFVTPDMW
jgi:hypothetical protein